MQSLSKWTKALIVAAFVILFAALASFKRMIAIVPLVALPTVLFIWYELKQHSLNPAQVETGIRVYILTGTVGMMGVAGGQAVLAYLTALIFFQERAMEYIEEFQVQEGDSISSEHRARRRDMASRWQYWVFLLCSTFVVIACLEEGLKYLAARLAVRRARPTLKRHYTVYAILASLGFSTVENFGFIYAAIQHESPLRFVITLITRIFAGTVLHALMAVLIAEEMIYQKDCGADIDVRAVLGLPVFFHGLFDFALLAISAANGNVGWMMPKGILSRTLAGVLGSSISLVLAMVVVQKRRRRHVGDTGVIDPLGVGDVQIQLVNSEDAQ